MEYPIERGPLLVRDRSLEEPNVELIDRSSEMLAVVVLVYRRLSDRCERGVDRFDDDRQVVDECAVPVPNHVNHGAGG